MNKINLGSPQAIGLVHYYPLNEQGGSIAFDGIGNLNGVLTNGAYFTNGACNFDGVDDYIETNYIPPSSTSFTMCGWGKSIANGIRNRVMGNSSSTTGLNGADIIWGYDAATRIYGVRRVGVNNGTTDLNYTGSSTSNLSSGWHFVAHTYDVVTGSALYWDGIQILTNSNLGFTSTLPFRIGRVGNGVDHFNGQIKDVRWYNRALSPTEVMDLYVNPNKLLK